MAEFGYALSSEEHPPLDLVRNARRAEEVGFDFAMISDHYHPWIDKQGHSGFVWAVIGGIAQATERLRLGTGVTCPTVRIHPGIIAQAAATAACMMPGRFMLGVGSGEKLNEHIFAHRWPPAPIRIEMMAEAVEVIRLLWQGGVQDHHGKYYTLENARIYDLPDELPPILVAASGPIAARTAGKIGDGLVNFAPTKKVVEVFEGAGGAGKPRYGQVTVCYHANEAEAKRIAYEYWPNSAITGELAQELPTPTHFEQASKMVSEEDVAESVVCGPDPQKHLDAIQEFLDAGFDHVYIHQVGPEQEAFFTFYEREILPQLRG